MLFYRDLFFSVWGLLHVREVIKALVGGETPEIVRILRLRHLRSHIVLQPLRKKLRPDVRIGDYGLNVKEIKQGKTRMSRGFSLTVLKERGRGG